MKIHGRKTYTTAIVLAVVGVLFLRAAGVDTWADPEAGVESAVRRVVGWLFICQAAGLAAIRHALSKTEARLSGLIRFYKMP